jgi:hypothetical protein
MSSRGTGSLSGWLCRALAANSQVLAISRIRCRTCPALIQSTGRSSAVVSRATVPADRGHGAGQHVVRFGTGHQPLGGVGAGLQPPLLRGDRKRSSPWAFSGVDVPKTSVRALYSLSYISTYFIGDGLRRCVADKQRSS